VWVDGKSVGETPVADLRMSLGAHEVRFAHPVLGERVRQVMVSRQEPTRLSLDSR
jgi:hypothetical protein